MIENQHKELRKHLSGAFELIRKISVKDEDVDHMALARQELRAAWKLVNEQGVKRDG